jgi:uncharacterized membrane protein YukC
MKFGKDEWGIIIGLSTMIFFAYLMYFRWKNKKQGIKENDDYLFENNYDRIRCSI